MFAWFIGLLGAAFTSIWLFVSAYPVPRAIAA